MTNQSERWISVEGYGRSLGVDSRHLPRTVRILLEAALCGAATGEIGYDDCEVLLNWQPNSTSTAEWRFPIARVLMQDASGLPLLADLAALRDSIDSRGRAPEAIDLRIPATLVFDHSIETHHWGSTAALERNMAEEFSRNGERYRFARWAKQAFAGLTIIPPGNGIVHQVHLEAIAELVSTRKGLTRCDSVIGTDSHTTMVNGLGIPGWGVGGIEAQSVLLGRPICIPRPEIIGVELVGEVIPGIGGSDLALALTARLRQEHVVGAFLEFFGPGVDQLSVADRCTIANMAPEFGATQALFPVDDSVLAYLADYGRGESQIRSINAHLQRQGVYGNQGAVCRFDRTVRVSLSDIGVAIAGPSRPDQLQRPADVASNLAASYESDKLDGRIVLAAITSCTNTANLQSMVTAGLLARRAMAAGVTPPPWVKTVFAPGSRSIVAALHSMGLLEPLQTLGFHVAAYGCGPCVGNTGALVDGVEESLSGGAVAVAVLSGNRNFEGRIHPAIRAAYLMSPAMVVAYAIAGRIDVKIDRALWPTPDEIANTIGSARRVNPYTEVTPPLWAAIEASTGGLFPWDNNSSFFLRPPFLDDCEDNKLRPIVGAVPLLLLGDSITTDHISPVGAISPSSEAGRFLRSRGVATENIGTYASRRVNHHVMLRGTFANTRLTNKLVPEQGPITRHLPTGRLAAIHEIASAYREEKTNTVILAGRNYGCGSARDWAAKGTALLGVRAVLARSFERIHRSNLVALGVLPIEVESPDDPWSGIVGATHVEVSIELSDTSEINALLDIQLDIDGELRLLKGRLRISTEVERRQLARGTMFHWCLREALADVHA